MEPVLDHLHYASGFLALLALGAAAWFVLRPEKVKFAELERDARDLARGQDQMLRTFAEFGGLTDVELAIGRELQLIDEREIRRAAHHQGFIWRGEAEGHSFEVSGINLPDHSEVIFRVDGEERPF